MIKALMSDDEMLECERLSKVFDQYIVYGDEDEDGVKFNVTGLTDYAPQEARAAYKKWESIVRPRNENGHKILA